MILLKVSDGVYRGSSPQNETHWKALALAGVKFTLDLQTGAPLLGDGSPLRESMIADRYGIRTYAHPLGEILPPTRRELWDAFHFIVKMKAKGTVFVHCHTGVDRTGMVMAFWQMIANHEPRQDAIDEMKFLGMHWWYSFWWPRFL